jgi:predicted CoA-binding protein
LDIPDKIDTVTLYVSPAVSDSLADQILETRPRRVIFNPGSENPRLLYRLREKGITGTEACTLVLLNTGRFE